MIALWPPGPLFAFTKLGMMSLPKPVFFQGALELVGPRPLAQAEAASGRSVLRSKARPSPPSRIAVIGNYLPRRCGIATFTTDLCNAISAEYGTARLLALPVNDAEPGYDYPARVRWTLAQNDASSYEDAARFLNFNNIDMVCLQHEYGIFGGPAGSYILHLLQALKMPVITTLHTVLREPDPDQLSVMKQIAELSDRLIVMSQLSFQFLQEIFKVSGGKIDIVPHGVPDLPFLDPNFYKDQFGVEGKAVLLTFGLLSPNKGIENVIQALPDILSKHSNVVYLVAGATHPHILRREGDRYREYLQALAKEVGVESNVIFHDRFVSPEEMVQFIGAADIYITPYRHEAQVVSGTLAYALGAGKAIISTPYWHAIELLDDRRGALVPFQNPAAIAQKTIELLDTPAIRHAMRKRAYLFARDMVWKKVAQGYMESFSRVRSDRMANPRVQFSARMTDKALDQLPKLKLNHLNRLTDDTGMLQHAIFTIPNRGEGYTTDDNARALIFRVWRTQAGSPPSVKGESPARVVNASELSFRYLAFLEHAFNPIEASAVNPYRLLAATRILACTLMMPLLTLAGDACGLLMGWVAQALVEPLSLHQFINAGFNGASFNDFLPPTFKTAVFGLIIGLIACFQGMRTQGGASGVGRAGTSSVVLSSLLVILADVVLVKLILIFFP
jgi:glycosyltransferase involved in cell wall biosynthesis